MSAPSSLASALGSFDVVDILVATLRVVASVFALWNVRWTACGAWGVMSGRFRPPELYLSVVFWMSVAVLVFQASYLSGQTPQWRLFAYVLLTVSMGAAAIGHRLGTALKARQFYFLYDHLEVALAISELARVDPEGAQQMASECRRRLVARLVAAHG